MLKIIGRRQLSKFVNGPTSCGKIFIALTSWLCQFISDWPGKLIQPWVIRTRGSKFGHIRRCWPCKVEIKTENHRGIDPIVTGSWAPQFFTLCYSLPIHFQGTCWKEFFFKNIYSFKIMCPQLWKFSFSAFSGQKISEGGVFWWWGQLF